MGFIQNNSTHVERNVNNRITTSAQNFVMALGKTVKTMRKARGWTPQELSNRSGVPVGTIGALEVRNSVRSEYSAQLAKGFGVSLEELFDNTLNVKELEKNASETNVNKETVTTDNVAIDVALKVLSEALDQTDPALRDGLAGMLSSLAKYPSNPELLGALTKMLSPDGFVERQQKAA